MTQTNNERELFETDDGKWDGVIRAFWRRIQGYKKCEFNDIKDLPDPLPVEFRAHFATALLNAPKELRESILHNEQQEAVTNLWEALGKWSAYLASNGEQANLAPPSWLIDAVKNATSPHKQAIPEDVIKDAARYRWLREVSRDPDESAPHCVVTKEYLEKGKPAKMISYLKFDEELDAEIDKAILKAAPTNTEVGE